MTRDRSRVRFAYLTWEQIRALSLAFIASEYCLNIQSPAQWEREQAALTKSSFGAIAQITSQQIENEDKGYRGRVCLSFGTCFSPGTNN